MIFLRTDHTLPNRYSSYDICRKVKTVLKQSDKKAWCYIKFEVIEKYVLTKSKLLVNKYKK